MRFLGSLIATTVRLVVRLVLLPLRLTAWVGRLGFRTGVAVGTAPVKVSWWATRRAGLKALVFLALGVALGLLLAPVPGAKLRARLLALATGTATTGATDPEVATAVRFELEHAPRTWHLTQPQVDVLDGRVTLSGTVPTGEDAAELERVAAAVPGVTSVTSRVTVAAPGDDDPTEVIPDVR